MSDSERFAIIETQRPRFGDPDVEQYQTITATCPKCGKTFVARESRRTAIPGTFYRVPFGGIQLSCPADNCRHNDVTPIDVVRAAPSR